MAECLTDLGMLQRLSKWVLEELLTVQYNCNLFSKVVELCVCVCYNVRSFKKPVLREMWAIIAGNTHTVNHAPKKRQKIKENKPDNETKQK